MDKDFNTFIPPFMDNQVHQNSFDSTDAFINPIMQYEQGYSYYKYLCMQLEYKMKYKEYEKMLRTNNNFPNFEKSNRRPE